MNGYWLVINRIDMLIEISFPDCEMFSFNYCLATMSLQQIEELLEILKGVKRETETFRKTYEYFTLDINFSYIEYEFHMFDKVISHYLYTEVIIRALTEYLEEYEKLRSV